MTNIGPIMLDIASYDLSEEDKSLLVNEQVGGLILFSRNFRSAEQVYALTQSIRAINPDIIIAVDQEGGRVQRFVNEFSQLPALAKLGELYQTEPENAIRFAAEFGELMSIEVQSVGCDISFAPVLDRGGALSKVIGNRAFSCSLNEITILAKSYIKGMNNAGMAATGKHFPGHGSVEADSHVDIPYDNRSLDEIMANDVLPFKELSPQLSAIMPAHIIYSQVDPEPAGFSSLWLQQILRSELGFNGVIFSDDLSMKGAEVAGSYRQRAEKALNAGCDMVLVCNQRDAVKQVIQGLQQYQLAASSKLRLQRLIMQTEATGLHALKQTERWQYLNARLQMFNQ